MLNTQGKEAMLKSYIKDVQLEKEEVKLGVIHQVHNIYKKGTGTENFALINDDTQAIRSQRGCRFTS